MTQSLTEFDIAIVGAGMIGLSLALQLSKLNIKVALIEKKALITHDSSHDSFSSRVSALTLKSQQFLTECNIMQKLSSVSCFYDRMHVWDGEGSGEISFQARENQLSQIGCITENRHIEQHLLQQLSASSVHIIEQQQVSAIKQLDHHVELKVNNHWLRTALLVAADGKFSTIAQLTQFQARRWSYNQTALVATIKTSKPHEHTARQNFTYCGALAFLPLHAPCQHYSNIVWSIDNHQLAHIQQHRDIKRLLSQQARGKLGEIFEIDGIEYFPLTQHHYRSYIKPNIALIGDAAHSIHPLAGQGANLGFNDCQALLEQIKFALKHNISLNHPTLLSRYNRQRQQENLTMMATMECFKRGFSGSNPVKSLLRGQALNWIDKRISLKQQILTRALGIHHK